MKYLVALHVDINKLDHVDIVTSVDNLDMFEDDSIDEIYSSHVLSILTSLNH